MKVFIGSLLTVLAVYKSDFDKDWYQCYSNEFVQNSFETDWKCVRIYVNVSDNSTDTFSFVKHAILHGGTKTVTSLPYYAQTSGTTAVVVTRDNPDFTPVTYSVQTLSPDLVVWTSMSDPSLYVWSSVPEGPTDEQRQYTMALLDSLGFNTYETRPQLCYDFQACPSLWAHVDPE